MGIKFIIFLGVLSLFYSCSSKKEQVESQVEERVLSAESLSINKDFLAKPEKIYCYDSLLFVWDSHNGQLCSLFNYLTGQYYGRFATLGNGPSEFALGTIGYPNQGKFYLSNYITGHIAQYDKRNHLHAHDFPWFCLHGALQSDEISDPLFLQMPNKGVEYSSCNQCMHIPLALYYSKT